MKHITIAAALLVSACGTYEPVVDLKGSDNPAEYQSALMECRYLSEQAEPISSAALESGAWTMVAVAATTAGTIALGGGPDGYTVAQGAAMGATGGLIGGAGAGAYAAGNEQDRLVRECLKGRGYSVLR